MDFDFFEKKVGFTCGAWDLLHPGHLYFLKECRDRCDELVIGLHVNPNLENKLKNVPVETVSERWYRLNSLFPFCNAIPYEKEEELINIMLLNNVSMRFLGSDYENRKECISHYDLLHKNGKISLVFIPRYHNLSSTNLRKRGNML